MKQLTKILLTLLLTFVCSVGISQTNLVPNFGFEQNSNCPSTEDQVQFCDGWSKYSVSSTTPDYYNDCSSSSTMGVPQNASFYQPDNRNCGAYMALYTWTDPIMNYREHIGVQLSQPLVIGQKYFLSFYTVLALQDDFSTPSNNIGMKLSTIPFNSTNPTPVDNFAHLRSASIVTDTANWVRISGSIVADSAYNYLILGNFYDDANTDTLTQTCGTCQNVFSYYLVDDVCISTDSTLCNGGILSLPCNVSVEETTLKNEISIYPNPAESFFTITKEDGVKDINVSIYNALGQLLYSVEKINSDNKQIDISSYNSGLLFIKIESDNKQYTYKLLKQ